MDAAEYLKANIRTVPDWPAPGVQFRDITPLLQDPRVFRVLIDAFVHRYMTPELRPTVVAGLDARGFIIGSVIAYELNKPLILFRKQGKLPADVLSESYQTEYGEALLEVDSDSLCEGDRVLIQAFVQRYAQEERRPDVVAGLDARGFILGAVVAYELNVGFVPIRKKGKLPFTTVEETYELEYGSATVELHTDAVKKGDRVLLIDDLIATGGTLLAAARLVRRLGAQVFEAAAIIDLPELGGSTLLQDAGIPTFCLTAFALDEA